jgi:hypothetical protein
MRQASELTATRTVVTPLRPPVGTQGGAELNARKVPTPTGFQATKVELFINLNTARALGLTSRETLPATAQEGDPTSRNNR